MAAPGARLLTGEGGRRPPQGELALAFDAIGAIRRSGVSVIAASRIRCSPFRRCSRWQSASSCRSPCLLCTPSGRPKTDGSSIDWTIANYARFFTAASLSADAASLVLAGRTGIRASRSC